MAMAGGDLADAREQSALKGVALVIAATLVFALGDVTTKHLTMAYSATLVVAVRYVVNLALLVVLLGPRHGRALVRTRRTGLVLVRAGALAVASLCMGLALRRMPVGETIAIVYLAPFVVMATAVPLLGEKVGPAGWIGAVAGFVGVLLIVRPGGGLDAAGVGFALAAAVAAVVYHLLSRILAATETTIALLFQAALVGTLVFGAMLPGVWDGALPTPSDALLMLALGVLATLGHYLFTAAYREAPASLLAPVNYLHLVWAGALGWLVFGHLPDGLTLLGMAAVTAAGAAVALRTQFAGARPCGDAN